MHDQHKHPWLSPTSVITTSPPQWNLWHFTKWQFVRWFKQNLDLASTRRQPPLTSSPSKKFSMLQQRGSMSCDIVLVASVTVHVKYWFQYSTILSYSRIFVFSQPVLTDWCHYGNLWPFILHIMMLPINAENSQDFQHFWAQHCIAWMNRRLLCNISLRRASSEWGHYWGQ